jgi:anti-anti-sigma regulatory factor
MSPSSSAGHRPSRKPKPDTGQDRRLDGTTVTLPDRMDFTAARELHQYLAKLRGSSVTVDGTAVVFGGALGAQVLLSASRDWAAAGHAWRLTVSTALRNDLQRLGLLGEFPNLVEVE